MQIIFNSRVNSFSKGIILIVADPEKSDDLKWGSEDFFGKIYVKGENRDN